MYLIYSINKARIKELAAEELSHIADKTYTEQGASLYDSIILTAKDDDLVVRYIDDAVSNFAVRTFDIYVNTVDGMAFFVPDFDVTMQGTVEKELERYLALFVVASFLTLRNVADAKEFAERTNSAANKAVTLLKSRKLPE